ncbi:MAG: hypothetical protein IJ104_08735 [Methanobrevibacter sp.]|nr:hypothetical protein [Methanobrevibacter sp.]
MKSLHWKSKNDIYSLIISLYEKNKIPIKLIVTTTHNPILCEMKKFNGDKNLNKIKKKFESNKELTTHDCAIIETIPDMQNSRNPEVIVEKLCHIIHDGKISNENRITIQSTMFLNIDYYVKEENKRKELMEMIDVENSHKSEFMKWQNEFEKKGEKICEKRGEKKGELKATTDIVTSMLETLTPKEITKLTKIPLSVINEIAKQINI